jgi:leader peptidase (prepilin peptidase)/N-methyltransferase
VVGIVIGIVLFACIALLAVELAKAVCARVEPLDGAPPSGEPPTIVLTAAAAFLGAALVARGVSPLEFVTLGILTFALAASWASDSLRGIVPDVFTLIPLGLLLLLAIVQRDWIVLVSAAVLFVPFAAAAWMTKGRGMGWGDVKLVTLAAAALGAPLTMLAMVVACIAAVIGYRLKRIGGGPIAFAPYIAAAVGVAIPLGMGH